MFKIPKVTRASHKKNSKQVKTFTFVQSQTMKCKNCQADLVEGAMYCHHCGGLIKTERITLKTLWKEFTKDFFGFDNKIFLSVKELLLRPDVVLKEYLSGVRNKYVKPANFIAIVATIYLITLSIFGGQMEKINNVQYELYYGKEFVEKMEQAKNANNVSDDSRMAVVQGSDRINKLMMKYFTLITFLFIPFYALLSFLTYRKPYNFGEHIIMNSYVIGFTFLGSSFLLLLSYLNPIIYYLYFPLTILYYSYAFSKVHNHGIGKAIWHILKFLFFLCIPLLLLMVGGIALGVYMKIKSGS